MQTRSAYRHRSSPGGKKVLGTGYQIMAPPGTVQITTPHLFEDKVYLEAAERGGGTEQSWYVNVEANCANAE